jgi:hypothetical protein
MIHLDYHSLRLKRIVTMELGFVEGGQAPTVFRLYKRRLDLGSLSMALAAVF